MEAATLLLGWGRMQARCVRGEGGVMWNEPKRPRTESRRMGKVDRKAKKGSNSPSIPNCLVSTLLGQTIVLCRFKLDFTLRKSASIDISDSEFRRRYGGVGVVLRHPIRVLLVDAQLTDPTGCQTKQTVRKTLAEQTSKHATVVQLAERVRRTAPDRTGDSAQEVAASQAQPRV